MNPAQILADVALPGREGAAAQRALLDLLGKLAGSRSFDADDRDEIVQKICWKVYSKAKVGPVIDTFADGVAINYLKVAISREAANLFRKKDPLRSAVAGEPNEGETGPAIERHRSEGPGPDEQTDRREAENTLVETLDPVLERLWARGRAARHEQEWRSTWAEILSLFKDESTVDEFLEARGIIPVSAADLKTQRNNIHKAHQYLRDRLVEEAERLLAEGVWDDAACQRAKRVIAKLKRNSDPVSAARKKRPLKKGGTQ